CEPCACRLQRGRKRSSELRIQSPSVSRDSELRALDLGSLQFDGARQDCGGQQGPHGSFRGDVCRRSEQEPFQQLLVDRPIDERATKSLTGIGPLTKLDTPQSNAP